MKLLFLRGLRLTQLKIKNETYTRPTPHPILQLTPIKSHTCTHKQIKSWKSVFELKSLKLRHKHSIWTKFGQHYPKTLLFKTHLCISFNFRFCNLISWPGKKFLYFWILCFGILGNIPGKWPNIEHYRAMKCFRNFRNNSHKFCLSC